MGFFFVFLKFLSLVMSTREGLSQFSLSWWLCAHSKLGRTKSARKLPKQKHSPPFCFPFLPLDVTGKTQKFQDKFESDLFGRFWGHMYTHDIRTIWKLIVINVPIVISWTFLVTPHSFRALITIERGIAVQPISNFSQILQVYGHALLFVGLPRKALKQFEKSLTEQAGRAHSLVGLAR